MDPIVLPPIELEIEDGAETQFFLTFDREPAFAITVVNHDSENDDPYQPRTKMLSATLKVSTLPIEGGEGETAEVKLYVRGQNR
jgi:hypothetical protein